MLATYREAQIARCEVCGRKVKQPSKSILNGRIICAVHNPRQDQRANRRDDRPRPRDGDRPDQRFGAPPMGAPAAFPAAAPAIAMAEAPAIGSAATVEAAVPLAGGPSS